MVYYILLVIMTIMGSAASLFLKKASLSLNIMDLIKDVNLYFGGLLYLGSAILNIFILRKMDYSVVLPLTSLTYIWTLLISNIVLKEKITKRKMTGVTLIFVGAVCISVG